jgi:hypothetical protein
MVFRLFQEVYSLYNRYLRNYPLHCIHPVHFRNYGWFFFQHSYLSYGLELFCLSGKFYQEGYSRQAGYESHCNRSGWKQNLLYAGNKALLREIYSCSPFLYRIPADFLYQKKAGSSRYHRKDPCVYPGRLISFEFFPLILFLLADCVGRDYAFSRQPVGKENNYWDPLASRTEQSESRQQGFVDIRVSVCFEAVCKF